MNEVPETRHLEIRTSTHCGYFYLCGAWKVLAVDWCLVLIHCRNLSFENWAHFLPAGAKAWKFPNLLTDSAAEFGPNYVRRLHFSWAPSEWCGAVSVLQQKTCSSFVASPAGNETPPQGLASPNKQKALETRRGWGWVDENAICNKSTVWQNSRRKPPVLCTPAHPTGINKAENDSGAHL